MLFNAIELMLKIVKMVNFMFVYFTTIKKNLGKTQVVRVTWKFVHLGEKFNMKSELLSISPNFCQKLLKTVQKYGALISTLSYLLIAHFMFSFLLDDSP